MSEPVRGSHLALLDRKSVQPGDQVLNHTYGFFNKTGKPLVNQKIRSNALHKWYYYPDMTMNEVIAFKQLSLEKDVVPTECQTVFHTAFTDPTTPEGAEGRKSCEFRAQVFVK